MRKMLRWLRMAVWVECALALALAIVPTATCLIAAQPVEKMACHDAMDHDDGGGSIDQNCCPGDSPSSSPAQILASISEPPSVLAAVLPVPLVSPMLGRTGVVDDTAPVKPPGTATYVLVSSFRI
jgi:hypothetical protein